MKYAVIFYFSGTGNTEIVANMIMKELYKHDYQTTLIRIEDVLKEQLEINLDKYDLIGIGCQIIGFGTPSIVNKFVCMLPNVPDKKVFIFRTAGGVAPINYNASKPIIRKLARKGFEVFYERVFSISSNWVVKFDNAVIIKLFDATSKKVAIMSEELVNGKKRFLKTGSRLRILMEIAMPIFSKFFPLVGKDLIINETCSHCGLCIKNCPANNIYNKKGKIKFRLSCNSCMRCVYLCPKSAIGFRFLTFFPIPGGYNIQKVLKEPFDSETATGKIPPFFYDYIKDDAL